MKRSVLLIVSIFFVSILSGCFLSEDKALEDAKAAAEKAFKEEPLETNQEIDQIALHKPDDMDIDGSSVNNVFLSRDGQDYLLFYNEFDNEGSKHLFESAKQRENSVLLESFEHNGKFGYIAVFPQTTEEQYELQVGIGGVKKISTITSMDKLEEEAKRMMEIVLSIQIKK
jgi:hypothetical protein